MPIRQREREKKLPVAVTMRLSISTLAILVAASSGVADAKYFSEGWKPGQPTTALSSANAAQTPFKLPKNIPKAPKQRPEPPRSLTDTLLLKFASLTGMKIPSLTGETSLDRYTWADDVEQGIERITDDNWEEEVVYERLAFEEEKDRVWVIMLHGPPRDSITPLYYDAHVNATALARKNGDTPYAKWARIDYITESSLSTRWLVFKPPYLVFASDRGQTLRFLHPSQFIPDGDILYRFIQQREYLNLPVWNSAWAPGGEKAWIVNIWLSISERYTKITGGIPSWIVFIVTGMITQSLLKVLHAGCGTRRKAVPKVSQGDKQK